MAENEHQQQQAAAAAIQPVRNNLSQFICHLSKITIKYISPLCLAISSFMLAQRAENERARE
jgi:hypothetical protein